MTDSRQALLTAVLVFSAIATLLVYVVLVPREIRTGGEPTTYVIAGWIPYTIAFYALGHRIASTGRLPSMRPTDAGAILVVLALLLSIALMSWGVTPEQVPEAHAAQAVAVFVGLALFGWGLGQRSAAIEAITDST